MEFATVAETKAGVSEILLQLWKCWQNWFGFNQWLWTQNFCLYSRVWTFKNGKTFWL